jgi:signal transduction histidine kinase/DNA-binding response OmpR family regulator
MLRATGLTIFLFLISSVLYGADSLRVVTVDPRYPLHELADYVEAFSDSTGALGVGEVALRGGDFRPLASIEQPDYRHAWWLRLRLTAAADLDRWILWLQPGTPEVADDVVAVFVERNGRFTDTLYTGWLVPASQKELRDPFDVNRVPLSLRAGDTVVVYTRLEQQQKFASYTLPRPVLHRPGVPVAYKPAIFDWAAVLFGISVIIGFFGWVLLLLTRDRTYLFFALWVTCMAGHYVILSPFLDFLDFAFRDYPQADLHLWNLFTAGGFTLYFLFGREFTRSAGRPRYQNYVLLASAGVAAVGFIVQSLTFISTQTLPSPAFMLAFGFFGIAACVPMAFSRDVLSRFFGISSSVFVFSSLLGVLYGNNVIALPFNPWAVGQFVQFLILALGLAYRFRHNEAARHEAEHIRSLDQIKTRFFTNISHEFRTPLTLILGPVKQWIATTTDRTPSATNGPATASVPVAELDRLRRNGERLLELVNQLLDLSRLEHGRIRLQTSRDDVVQRLRVLAHSFESLAGQTGVQYQIQLPAEPVFGWFDADKLEKIAVNLLSNAFKHTSTGGVVRCVAEVADKRLHLTVEDTGRGMEPAELDRIFERFYQIDSSLRSGAGSGIGLALVKELVDLHRGQLSVNSRPGAGSVFRVSLPLEAEAYTDEERTGVPSAVSSRQLVVAPETVSGQEQGVVPSEDSPLCLVVEDNRDVQAFIGEQLATRFRVEYAADGPSGLTRATELVPDLVVSDVMMPGFDGIELCARLKTDQRTSHIPVILLTARADQASRLQGLETGADDYLTKPFDAVELATRAVNLVELRRRLRVQFSREVVLKPKDIALTSADERFLQTLLDVMEARLGDDQLGVEDLARAAGMSRSQLHRKLTALIDQPPVEFIRNFRLRRAKEMLEAGVGNVSEVGYDVGFSSPAYFSKVFKDTFGVAPSEVLR